MPDRQQVLILGGTSEAVDLANAVTDRFDITYSLAGRTKVPSIPEKAATIRTGGFGGVTALSAWMRGNDVTLVIDATHPFAEQISANAADACKMTGTPIETSAPRLECRAREFWHRAEDVADAAVCFLYWVGRLSYPLADKNLTRLLGFGRCVFLSAPLTR